MFTIRRLDRSLIVLFSVFTFMAFAQRYAQERVDWNRPMKPFRIAGNIYYVGAAGVSSFLITTPQGAILIDGGLPETAPLIEKSIAQLGFKIADVKYLLNSHAHFDHAGGLAELKRLSGAQVVASAGDSETLRTGVDSFLGPEGSFPPVKVDRVIGENETIRLGETVLTAHLTPGHTRGSTTWAMPVSDRTNVYQAVFHSSTTVAANRLVQNRNYPQIVSDYRASFAKLRKLPCDIFLAPHGSFFQLAEKLQKRTDSGPNPFIDSGELKRFVDKSEQDFEKELKEQESKVERAE